VCFVTSIPGLDITKDHGASYCGASDMNLIDNADVISALLIPVIVVNCIALNLILKGYATMWPEESFDRKEFIRFFVPGQPIAKAGQGALLEMG